MKTILCVIDLTEPSLDVLQLAVRIAATQNASLSILAPYRLINPNHPGDAGKLRAALEQQALANFSAFKNRIPLLESVSSDFKAEIGFAGSIVAAFVHRQPVDMVVIGQALAKNIQENNGISLEDLIDNLKVPLTIVPSEKYIGIA